MSNKPANNSYSQPKKSSNSLSNNSRRNSSTRRRKPNSSHSTNSNEPVVQLPQLDFTISGLTHDGRGVAVYGDGFDATTGHSDEKNGKKIFINFALPSEVVKVQLTNARKNYEEGDALEVIANDSADRVAPFCKSFTRCGGCSLQHWNEDKQIQFKQSVLAEQLEHQAGVQPEQWLAPLVADRLGYRTKARLGVRYIDKRKRVVLGFRERGSNRLTNISTCAVMDDRVGNYLSDLRELLESLEVIQHITHIEVAVGEEMPELVDGNQPVAMIIRHMKPMPYKDLEKLKVFFAERQWQLYLQEHSVKSIRRIRVQEGDDISVQFGSLYYELPEFGLTYEFVPTDFTQVNMSVNRKMVKQACDLLDLKPGERVLDLFSGLGNFSLPMAKLVGGEDGTQGRVIGIDLSNSMAKRSMNNASRNGVSNARFYTHDLTEDLSGCSWMYDENTEMKTKAEFDALLIDPPRLGALEIMQYVPQLNPKRIVYVSCNPATLARDSKLLIEMGYRLTHAGVMDMFSHTSHVESILKFEK